MICFYLCLFMDFCQLLSQRVIYRVASLSDSYRKLCFVIDDSMLQRNKGKEVELMARIYDHVSKSFVKGFNLLQLGWTDGVSIFPVNSALMSSSKCLCCFNLSQN